MKIAAPCSCLVLSGLLCAVSYAVNVTTPPLIIEEPEKLVVFHEDPITLPCVASGEPTPEYQWMLDDKLFDPDGTDGRIIMQDGVGTLIFLIPLVVDEGMFQCLATNDGGTAQTVKVDFRQAYIDPFQTGEVRNHWPQLGDSLTLGCVPPLSFPPANVSWAIVTSTIDPIDLDDRVTMDLTGNLHFANVDELDEQGGETYGCVASNEFTSRLQLGEYATVTPQGQTELYFLPTIQWASPTQQISHLGHTWRIKCIFAGNPTCRVDWERIGGSMPEGRWRLESYRQELVIDDIQLDDAGIYECQGVNEDFGVPVRKSFELHIEAEPYWLTTPESVKTIEGDDVIFTCESDGIPEPVNFWFINGISTSVLPDDPKRIVEQTSLTFLNVTTDYTQVIQCNSTNRHGYVYANAYLNVL